MLETSIALTAALVLYGAAWLWDKYSYDRDMWGPP